MTETNIVATTPTAASVDVDLHRAAPEQGRPPTSPSRAETSVCAVVSGRVKQSATVTVTLSGRTSLSCRSQIATHVAKPAALRLLPDLDPHSLLEDNLALDAEKVEDALEQLRQRPPRLSRRFMGSTDGGVGSSRPRSRRRDADQCHQAVRKMKHGAGYDATYSQRSARLAA